MFTQLYRKQFIGVLIAIALVLGAFPAVVNAQGFVQLATVSSGTAALNVRSGPGTAYPVLRWLEGGQQIGLVGRNADASWLQLQSYDGQSVEWVSARYVTAYENVMALPVTGGQTAPPASQTVQLATVSASIFALNVRSGPGTAYPVQRWLVTGQQIGLVGRNADASWLQLQSYNGQSVEWVSAHYVTAYENVMALPVTG